MNDLQKAIAAAKAAEATKPTKTGSTGYRHKPATGTLRETPDGPELVLTIPLTVDDQVRTSSTKGLQLSKTSRHKLDSVEVMGCAVYAAWNVECTLPEALWDAERVAQLKAEKEARKSNG